uniref:R3H-assoc domain-containing protein n=1 Tax=Mesocestoides corti TaxID=53468 RepID=A0A5K3EXM1_MESCO
MNRLVLPSHRILLFSLRLQSLNHYSDFDGTSESEASEISIVLPYLPRLRGKKLSKAAEGQVRLKRGSRALRRYENEAYLSSLVMITEADAEYEADDYWPDKTNDDTAFKCLFEDEDIRAVWDAFIALSERKQIELLGALDNRPVSGDDDDDLNYEDVDMGDEMAAVRPPRNYNNCASGRSRHGNRRRCRRKPAVRLEGIKEDPSEEAMDAFGKCVELTMCCHDTKPQSCYQILRSWMPAIFLKDSNSPICVNRIVTA